MPNVLIIETLPAGLVYDAAHEILHLQLQTVHDKTILLYRDFLNKIVFF